MSKIAPTNDYVSPCVHPKPGDPDTVQYHLGLTKLELFAAYAMQARIIAGCLGNNYERAADDAVKLLSALEALCPSCQGRRSQWKPEDDRSVVYYICGNSYCSQYRLNDELSVEDLEQALSTMFAA